MNNRGIYPFAAIVLAAGLVSAAFPIDTFRKLQTTVAASTTNICTNVNIVVSELDTVGLQFAGSLAKVGEGNVVFTFQRGYTNALDKATFMTWTISTVGWASNNVFFASTNLVSVRDFQSIAVYSIANGNTSALSSVSLTYGSK